jgi:hypothetical protein
MHRAIDSFIYQTNRYYGNVKPENLVFNSNLQEFTQRIIFVCCLETGGKITPAEAYQEIKYLWEQLDLSKRNLGIKDNDLN